MQKAVSSCLPLVRAQESWDMKEERMLLAMFHKRRRSRCAEEVVAGWITTFLAEMRIINSKWPSDFQGCGGIIPRYRRTYCVLPCVGVPVHVFKFASSSSSFSSSSTVNGPILGGLVRCSSSRVEVNIGVVALGMLGTDRRLFPRSRYCHGIQPRQPSKF